MTFAEFFAAYWWLMFPVFGMVMAFQGMNQSEKRQRRTLDLIRSYVEQGKEPPAELLKLAQKTDNDDWDMGFGPTAGGSSSSSSTARAWTFVTFAALAAGFGAGWWFVRGEDYAFAFLIVAVTMGVLALGALGILIFGGKK